MPIARSVFTAILAVAAVGTAIKWSADMGNAATKATSGVKTGWKPATAPTSPQRSRSGFDITPLTLEQREKLAQSLTPLQRKVTLEAGTERAFTGTTTNGFAHDNKAKGVYVSAIGTKLVLRLCTHEHKCNHRWLATVFVRHKVRLRDRMVCAVIVRDV